MATLEIAQLEADSFSLTTCLCLVCKGSIDEISTAVYSRRNKAFLHYECRDMVLAKRAEREAQQARAQRSESTLGENCPACEQPVDLAEECWMSGGRTWHCPCRPTSAL